MIRESYATPFLDKLGAIVSELGDKYFIAFAICMSYHVVDHAKSFVLLLSTVICTALPSLLKSFYHEARPFFEGDFKPNGCRLEYGNPSGHSQIAVGLYLTLWYVYYQQYSYFHKFYKYTALVIIIINMLVIGASRIYNGIHTYNQVISGYAWGLLAYLSLCHVFFHDIAKFVNSIQTKTARQLIFNPYIGIFLVGHALSIASYFYNCAYNPIPEKWIQHIEKNCSSHDIVKVDVEQTNYLHFQFSWAFFGAYLGLIIEKKYLASAVYHQFFNTKLPVTIKRLIYQIPWLVVTQAPLKLVSKNNPFLIIVIFKTIFPVFVGNLYLFGFSKRICQRIGCINFKREDRPWPPVYEAGKAKRT